MMEIVGVGLSSVTLELSCVCIVPMVCGYPVYDRNLITPELLREGCRNAFGGENWARHGVKCVSGSGNNGNENLNEGGNIGGSLVTLIGDAAHPMSMFKVRAHSHIAKFLAHSSDRFRVPCLWSLLFCNIMY